MTAREIIVETKARGARRTLTLPAKRPAPATAPTPSFEEPAPVSRRPARVEKPVSILQGASSLTQSTPVPRKHPPRDLKKLPIEGAPVSANLALEHRPEKPIGKPITEETRELVARIMADVKGGDPRTLGLRVMLAATKHGPGYRIGMLGVALYAAGHVVEASKLRESVLHMKAARFEEAAATSLALAEAKHAERDAEREAMAVKAATDGEAVANG